MSHSQLPPPGDWRTWYVRGGRGSGKTRTGAETLRDWIIVSPPSDWAIVAPTDGAARKVCMEGRHSGLISAFGGRRSSLIDNYHKTDGTLTLWNGSRVLIDGADDGALRIQGENLAGAWCDEIGLWRDWDVAWNESIRLAVRMEGGRIIATGTPKQGHGLVRQLLHSPKVEQSHMRLVDNEENLPSELVADFYTELGGTRRGRQELEGEFIEEVEGALWTREMIERSRVKESEVPRVMSRTVVAVDPQVSTSESAHEAGIVVCGRGYADEHCYVLEDCTERGGPDSWTRRVVQAYLDHNADCIIAEKNNGGELVRIALHTIDSSLPVKLVWASEGKRTRAEPVQMLYERLQPVVHHVGAFPYLEDEMCSYVPVPSSPSPNRMDALVWGVGELMLKSHGASVESYLPDEGEAVYRKGDLVMVGDRYFDEVPGEPGTYHE